MSKLTFYLRFPLLAAGLFALLIAMWAGLTRLGWNWPHLQPGWPMLHGPLMIAGFLGTVIGLERAVALSSLPAIGQTRQWPYIGPLLTALGGLSFIVGLSSEIGGGLITLGSLNLVIVFFLILRIQLAPFTLTMATGAALWLIGNSLWLLGRPISDVVSWWSGFLILTIAGERLELNRVLRLSGVTQTLFLISVGLILAGLSLSLMMFNVGFRLTGLGLLALALWLLRYDIARHTVRKTGLTRFMAICLLAGYGWLGFGGLLALFFGGLTAGFRYDAIQHAIFVGFVISMIFGHAPIIFPAIIGKALPFRNRFYLHLVLLHLSLLLRVMGDLTGWLPGRQWGGLLNAVAILLFLANTILAIRYAASRSAQTVTPQGTS